MTSMQLNDLFLKTLIVTIKDGWPNGYRRTVETQPSLITQVRTYLGSFQFFGLYFKFYQILNVNNQFQRSLVIQGLCPLIKAPFKARLGAGPIYAVPRSQEKIKFESGTFYYTKIGLGGVTGSNPRLSQPFLSL